MDTISGIDKPKQKQGKRISKRGRVGEGRPTVFTESVLGKLEEAFAMGCSDKEACLYANISQSTLCDYQKKNQEFLERKELLKQQPVLKARKAVIRGFDADPSIALKFLERRCKEEFSLKTEVEHSTPDDKPLFVINMGTSGSNPA